MLSKLYKKVFISAFNLSIIKTYLFNVIYFKVLMPKLFLGKGTSIVNQGGELEVVKSAFIDCKNAGQFSYSSHIVLERGSKLTLGDNVNFFSGAQIKCFTNSNIAIGNDTYFSGPLVMHAENNIRIGARCSISWGVTIIDSNFHSVGNKKQELSEVVIEDNVWIGCNVTILKGVYIPEGSIIAANSLVNRNLVKKGLYAGNPIKFIRDI